MPRYIHNDTECRHEENGDAGFEVKVYSQAEVDQIQGEHTPGPWEYSRRTDRPPYNYHVSQTGGGHIVTVHDEGGGYVHESNAALIAAAPELLAACKAALELLRDGDSDEYFDAAKLETMLEKAIERAQGEPV